MGTHRLSTTTRVASVDRSVGGPAPDTNPGGGGSTSGATVRSVAMTVPSDLLAVAGSPVTQVGTLAVTLPVRPANRIFAGPATGADASPTFRAQVQADLPNVDRISGSTYSTLQHFINTMHSPGLISGGELSVLSATQVRVAAGTGMIRIADDNVSSLPFFDWVQTDFTIPADDTVRYFGVVYNAGAPIVEMRTAESWDKDTEWALGTALHISSNGILVLTNPFKTGDPTTNIIQRFDATAPVLRDAYVGGLMISNVGTRNIAITAGQLWHRLNDNPFAAFDSSGASRFTTVYFDGAAWVFTPSIAQWPNAQYNDITTGLVAITGNRYVNLWFYIGATGANVFMVYGQAQHVLLADALAEGEPTFFPTGTRPFVVLVGKLTFQNGGSTPTQLLSPFTAASLGGGSVNTHNDLGGLQGGTTAEYYHLTSAAYSNVSAGTTATPQFARLGLGTAADGTALLKVGSLAGLLRATAGVVDAITYEEGTFNPTMSFVTPGDLSVSYATQLGIYVKIGKLVYFTVSLVATPTYTTAAGNWRLTGLPFTSSATANQVAMAFLSSAQNFPASVSLYYAVLLLNSTTAALTGDGSGISSTQFSVTQFASGVSISITISGAYMAAA